jgi:hypothetical protein
MRILTLCSLWLAMGLSLIGETIWFCIQGRSFGNKLTGVAHVKEAANFIWSELCQGCPVATSEGIVRSGVRQHGPLFFGTRLLGR